MALFRALKRRLPLALGLAILVSGSCALAAWFFLPPPVFTAQAKLLVKAQTPRVASHSDDANGAGEDFRRYQKTQLNLITSRRVIQAALLKPKISSLAMIREQTSPIDFVRGHLKVEFPQESEVMDISLGGKDPKEVAEVVNAIQTAFMDEVVNSDLKQRKERQELLRRLKQGYLDLIKNRRETLHSLVKSAGSDDKSTLVLKQQYALEQRAAIRRELTDVQSQMRKIEAILNVQRPEDFQETAAPLISERRLEALIEQDPDVSALRDRLADMQDRLTSEAAHTGRIARSATLNPGLKNMRDEIESAKKQLEKKRKTTRAAVIRQLQEAPESGEVGNGGSSKSNLAVLKVIEKKLEDKLSELSKTDRTLTEDTLNLQDLQDDLKQYQELADGISRDNERLNIELQAPSRIVKFEDATAPETRDVKKWLVLFGLISAGSFLVTLFGVAFLELQAQKIDSADEVVSNLGLPVVGSLPMLPNRTRRHGVVATRERDRYWYNLLLESIDATRTMLIHAAHTGNHRVVMITSALSGEGKTSLASHLATSLARSGLRTLLIDADLRSPSLHRLFDLTADPGLSEVLRGEAAVEDMVTPTAIEELKVITAGICDHQTLRILSQGGMGSLFGRLKESYDFVIVDSSPILPVADSLIIAQQVDAVLLSVLTDVSRKHKIFAAYQRLVTLGVRVLGAVVTGAHDGVYGTNYYPGEFHSTTAQPQIPSTETEAAS
jgi:capsular exopolysaccharide synthesis family protein